MNTPHKLPSGIHVRGFTLVEMLVALTLLAATVALAVPSFAAIGRSMRLTSMANTFLASLHLARGEAIKRNSRVVMCKSASGDVCATSGDWSQGWLVFHDANNNGLLDAGETIVHRVHGLPAGFNGAGNQPVARYVSFSPTGGTKSVNGAFQAGTVTFCQHSADPGEARQIVINSIGRPRVQKVNQASCL